VRTSQIKPVFQLLDPSELNDLYSLEQPYFWLMRKLQTQGISALNDAEQMDVLSGRSATRLSNALDHLGSRLYGLCQSVNICTECTDTSSAVCPNCMTGKEGSWIDPDDDDDDDDDDDYGNPATMSFIEDPDNKHDDTMECELCGHRMTLYEWQQAFPTTGTDYGKEHIYNFMSQWNGLSRDKSPESIPPKIILIHSLLNAIHGRGPMARMFFSGPTTETRRKLDELSENTASIAGRMVRLARRLDEIGMHRMADMIDSATRTSLIPAEISSAIPEIYCVGGCVRDLVLGKEPKDIDLCTPLLPREIIQRCETAGLRVIPTGEKHGTVTVMVGKVPYEITTFRTDVETDGRHADVRFTNDLNEDLARRDFTINAMALSPSGEIIDPFDGIGDLNRRMIRCVGDPDERFSEDMLRILRAARFAARYGFLIDADTVRAMREMSPILLDRIGKQDIAPYRLSGGREVSLAGLSIERIRDEFDKAFSDSERPSRFLRTMWDLGVVQTIIPEMSNADDLMQDPIYHPEGSVWNHVLEVVDRASPGLRWNALLHDVGKCAAFQETEMGHNSFHGHDEAGADMIGDIAKRLRLTGSQEDSIEATTRLHMNPMMLGQGEISDRNIRRLQHRAGPHLQDLRDVTRADAGPRYQEGWNRLFETLPQPQVLKPALMGRHLIERGMSPGPEMRPILDRAFQHQLDTGEMDIDRLFEVGRGGVEASSAKRMMRLAQRLDDAGHPELADDLDAFLPF